MLFQEQAFVDQHYQDAIGLFAFILHAWLPKIALQMH